MRLTLVAVAAACLTLSGLPLAAQDVVETPKWKGQIEPVSGFTGQMSMTMEGDVPADMAVEEVIRFEPWQMLDDLFRDDLVFLMRSGPTDWNTVDAPDAAVQDCASQRLVTEAGQDQMRQLGALLIVNGLKPGAITLSDWCRAQQTYLSLEEGMVGVDMNTLDGMNVGLDPTLRPLDAGDETGAVEALRARIMAWDGEEAGGPLLLITHFDNIETLTRFRVYEGEMLIVDPTRDGRVLGYVRLGSAVPDAVRFDPDVVAFALRPGADTEGDAAGN